MGDECRICGNSSENLTHTSREMMYGTFEEFDYIECSKCGCLQIAEYQKDIARHYPDNYYSFSSIKTKESKFKLLKKKIRAYCYFHKNSYFRRSFSNRLKLPKLNIGLLNSNINFDTKILDVGCGSGELLFDLKIHGFRNLTGVDPYIEKNINIAGISIVKSEIFAFKDKFDFIMLNHSFEHMERPLKVLTKLQSLLSVDGVILIRVPVASSYAWKHYGVNWVQLDPPRHYYLHTEKSITKMAANSGLMVDNIIYDSESFQFTGSELYQSDIPMPHDRETFLSKLHSICTEKKIKEFDRKTITLNNEKLGDQACFFLKRTV